MGNSNGQANDMVSVYLNYGDPKHAKDGWHVCAQFALAISNPVDPTCFIQSRTSSPALLHAMVADSRMLDLQRPTIALITKNKIGVSPASSS